MCLVAILKLSVTVVQCSLASGGAGDMLVKIWYCLFEIGVAKPPATMSTEMMIQSDILMYLPQSSVHVYLSWNINGTDYNQAKFIRKVERATI